MNCLIHVSWRGKSHAVPGLLKLAERLHQAGVLSEALNIFESVARQAALATAWQAVATLRFQLGRPQAALDACNEALRLEADNPDALFNRAVVLATLGRNEAARQDYQRVLELAPQHRGMQLNYPQLLLALHQEEAALQLASCFRTAAPDDADLIFNHGELLTRSGEHETALAAYRRAVELRPDAIRFAIAAAVALAACGDVRAASDELVRLQREHPREFAAFRSPLETDALAMFPEIEAGRLALFAEYQHFRYSDWSRRERFSELFSRQIRGDDGKAADNPDIPFLAIGLPLSGELHLQLAQNVARRIADSVKTCTFSPQEREVARERTRSPDRGRQEARLRIGYLSGDFRQHPTAMLMSRLPGLHDRGRFEVFSYSSGPVDQSSWRAEIIAGSDVFRDVSRSNAGETAQRIADDGIDILVDLSGYVLYSRAPSLALRPAPVQISHLAYLQTSGAPWIDYALLDRTVLTERERPYWQECIAYLPHCLYVCDDRPPTTVMSSRGEHGLPDNAFVFCSLNAAWKIDPESFASWMRILERTPQSVLWLYDDTGHSEARLRAAALAAGIDGARLIFTGKLAPAQHLARYRLADLFLDALYCNAHTTCIEALAAGLPVLTLPGERVVSRVAASCLTAHGVPELVVESRAAYEALACRLASDTAYYQAMRQKVAQREGSRLLCTERRVRELERVYTMIWARHQAGLPPEDFDVPTVD